MGGDGTVREWTGAKSESDLDSSLVEDEEKECSTDCMSSG
jgi:hypothetical protein